MGLLSKLVAVKATLMGLGVGVAGGIALAAAAHAAIAIDSRK
ncbi:hypothetical protein [Rubrimonas cliftonensis]|uniref:Uncharacterized protein n=1 Tax=Rubrimonas cliftonensis TaxID=89524 RepID=A0A1H4GBM6_9RHOB|nr:hypothetical protein [Rubrimonas cliftonensis]SEB06681.1 hypothetical protein SAMN05444370_1477 [Rubrimonas cliftonensis]